MEENQVVTVAVVDAPKGLATKYKAAAVAAGTFAVINSAQAVEGALEVPDMAPIVALIMGMVALVASIGMAVLSVYATGKVFKWVKAAF